MHHATNFTPRMLLNYIWIAFFIIAFLIALFKLIFLGDIEVFSKLMESTFEMSKTAFDISIGLTGILALWMGLMKIAEESGVVKLLAKALDPLFLRLFPGVPAGHSSMGPIVMNIAANMLGLDNAATPLGLKAMEELQELNPDKETATNAQIMLLVLNTSGLTLIPVTIFVYRAQMGAATPTDVFIPILLATLCATIGGLIVVSIWQKINMLDPVILAYLGGLVVVVGLTIWQFSGMTQSQIENVSIIVSNLILFSVIIFFILMAFFNKVNAYDAFVEGAKEGFTTAVKIIPYLVAMLVAIGVLRASGALDLLVQGIAAFFALFGLEGDFIQALPTALMRPLSGSGARGLMLETMETFGADSLVGRMVSIMQGTTDTTLYIIAVYFGSVNIKRTRHALPAGLLADLIGVVAAILITYLFFGEA